MTENLYKFDVAQFAHSELLTPKPEETLDFFHRLLGMEVTHREGDSVYLRAYEDAYKTTLKITASDHAGVGHIGWRVRSEEALARRVEAIEATGLGKGWIDGDFGHGRAYQFETPHGHLMEVFFDVTYYAPGANNRSRLLNRISKRPDYGIPVKRLDHINLMTPDPKVEKEFMEDVLGFSTREKIVDGDEVCAAWMAVTELAHDIAFMRQPEQDEPGKLHHLCYWYDDPGLLYEVADLLKDNGINIEVAPNKHGVSQAFCMYAYEPGGNRIELFGGTGYLVFDPTHVCTDWEMATVAGVGDTWIGQPFPDSWWNRGTPVSETSQFKGLEDTGHYVLPKKSLTIEKEFGTKVR